jgi:hypothetical protein
VTEAFTLAETACDRFDVGFIGVEFGHWCPRQAARRDALLVVPRNVQRNGWASTSFQC